MIQPSETFRHRQGGGDRFSMRAVVVGARQPAVLQNIHVPQMECAEKQNVRRCMSTLNNVLRITTVFASIHHAHCQPIKFG